MYTGKVVSSLCIYENLVLIFPMFGNDDYTQVEKKTLHATKVLKNKVFSCISCNYKGAAPTVPDLVPLVVTCQSLRVQTWGGD